MTRERSQLVDAIVSWCVEHQYGSIGEAQQAELLSSQQFVSNLNRQQRSEAARDLLRELDELAILLDAANQTIGEQVETEARYREVVAAMQPLRDLAIQQLSESESIRVAEHLATQQPSDSTGGFFWAVDYAISPTERVDIQTADYSANQLASNPATQQASNSDSQQPKPPVTLLDWCSANNWSDPHWVVESRDGYRWGRYGRWWAFEGAAVMSKPLPDSVQTVKADTRASQLGTLGTIELSEHRLYWLLGEYVQEHRRSMLSEDRLNLASLVSYFDKAFKLLQPEQPVRVVNYEIHRGFSYTTVQLAFACLEQVTREMPSMYHDQRIAELGFNKEAISLQLTTDHNLVLWLLRRAFEVLQQLGLSPHPRWNVGTTAERQFFANENLTPAEINQRDSYLSSPYQCGWSE